MRKRSWNMKWTAFLLSAGLVLAASGCGAGSGIETTASAETSQASGTDSEGPSSAEGTEDGAEANPSPVSKKDDYFEAVNGELLAGWEIAPDQSSVSWFNQLDDENTERMTSIIQAVADDTSSEKGSDENNIRALYLTGMDQEGRNEGGYGKILSAYFAEIDKAGSIDVLMRACLQFDRTYGLFSIAGLSCEADYADSNKKVLVFYGGDTGLSKEIWFSEDPVNQNRVTYFQEALKKLCIADGYSEEEASAAMEKVFTIMKTLAENSLSLEDSSDPEKTYNLYTVSQLEELFSGTITADIIQEIFSAGPDETVVVYDVHLAETMASLLTEDNLPALKEYVKLCARKDTAGYADIESYEAVTEYNRKSAGLEESQPFEEDLFNTVQGALGYQCGRLYCEQYFPEETIEDVSEIVSQVIDVFDERISGLEWMSDATKAEARNKLASLTVRIGHPTEWPQDRYELVLYAPDEGGLYIDNALAIMESSTDYAFETRDEPVDKTLWPSTPQTINAFYSPLDNSINILAGILRAPFYDPEASAEENLGGIGTVIGHEITHAFDMTGSQFDEKGNLRDWWTEEDKKNFQALAEDIVAYYSSMEVDGRQVNGSQTISENIADLGGVSCITQIAQENGYDLEKVYESYANIWAFKCREEYLANQISTDVHSPAKIRVNAVLSAQQAFRDLYDVQEGDGMYQEMMPGIW